MMKKRMAALLMATVFTATALVGCGAQEENKSGATFDDSSEIEVISRENGSGTRGAFIELFGVEQKNDAGEKIDYTTVEAIVTNNTSVMMTTVANNEYAIGYISLGSMNDTIKSVKIDGVDASVENIENGTYTVNRPFNVAVKDSLSDAAQDFFNYIMSAEGQAVIEEEGYIQIDDTAAVFESSHAAGKVVVAGSSSVTPVMEKLKEAYEAVNPEVMIEINTSDSSTGVSYAIEGTCDIGMASRALKESELSEGVTEVTIAKDGIAVIVNKNNPIDDLTTETVKNIYTGDILTWSEI